MSDNLTTQFDFEQFKQDRLEMLLALDVAKCREYMTKYGVSHTGRDDETLLLSMHMARMELTTLSEEDKAVSRQWLAQRGLRREHWGNL